jgi:hypothetical protein
VDCSVLLYEYDSFFLLYFAHNMKHRYRLSFVCVYAALFLLFASANSVMLRAQDASKAAAVFQAVYIYNFTRYVYFPPARNTGDFVIGILGRTDAAPGLERMANIKKAGITGQQIRIVVYDAPTPAMTECHFVYVPDKFTSRLPQVVKLLKGQSTLIVTEGLNSANGIPAISMVSNSDKKFHVNNKAIEDINLKVSADFLRFAALVQ